MNLCIIISLSFVCYTNCILYSINVVKGPSEKDWKQYKSEFNKTYPTKDQEQSRFKNFKHNWISIQKHNKRYDKGQETYLQEINHFADLTEKEFSDLYGLHENDKVVRYTQDTTMNRTKINDNGMDFLDWKEDGAVTPAQDQGSCGSCWAFCAVGVLESYHFRKTGKLLDFSEQYIVDCKSSSSCSGGVPLHGLQFIKEKGMYLESTYPYNGRQNDCQNVTTSPFKFNFENAYIAVGNDEELKEELKKHGPLSVNLYASSKWMFYKSGVWYASECSSEVNHCLLLVGYGTENGIDYWLFKNSWGRQWGQDGFIKLARNRHENYCGIEYGLYLK